MGGEGRFASPKEVLPTAYHKPYQATFPGRNSAKRSS